MALIAGMGGPPAEEELAELVDFERYPLHQLNGPQGESFLARCRASLASDGGAAEPALPAEQPCNAFIARSSGFGAGDQAGGDAALRRLYPQRSCQELVRRALGAEERDEYADPLGCQVVNVLKPG